MSFNTQKQTTFGAKIVDNITFRKILKHYCLGIFQEELIPFVVNKFQQIHTTFPKDTDVIEFTELGNQLIKGVINSDNKTVKFQVPELLKINWMDKQNHYKFCCEKIVDTITHSFDYFKDEKLNALINNINKTK